jgi:WXG100 family type VII secretion target
MPDITVHYAGVDNAGEALGAATKAINDVLEELATSLNAVRNQWVGNSSEQYTTLQSRWNQAAGDMSTQLGKNQVNLAAIRENYSSTDSGLALTWSEIGGV